MSIIAEQSMEPQQAGVIPTNTPQITLQTGSYTIHNDYLTLNIDVGATEYRYDFQMFRNSTLPDYLQEDSDFLDMYWAGFKVQPDDIVPTRAQVQNDDFNQQYIQIKVNNYNENKFKFKKLPENI